MTLLPLRKLTISILEFLFERVLAYTAAIIMFLMMIFTLIDVIGRDFFNSPLPGGFEVTELFLSTIIFLGLPMVTAEASHVDVDICDPTIPEWIKPYQDICIGLVNIFCFSIMSWMLFKNAVQTYEYQDTTAILQFPYFILVSVMATMTSLATVSLVAMLFMTRGRTLFKGQSETEEKKEEQS
ncbi:MAG: TRAP transporter small permease [Methylocystaceae bacterium]|nr:TRAP transporter small permease [Methylocystaceae bacterium]